jgi:hypothetical protein
MFGAEPESPYWTAGKLLLQVRLLPIRLASTSIASGSPMVLLANVALPPIWLRIAPSQHEFKPTMLRSPPMLLSSASL